MTRGHTSENLKVGKFATMKIFMDNLAYLGY